METILDLIGSITSLTFIFLVLILIKGCWIARKTRKGEITEIFPDLFRPLGLWVGVESKGGFDWELVIVYEDK